MCIRFQVLSAAGLDVVGGGVAAVAVGGFLTGCENSALSPLKGLANDNIVSMKVADVPKWVTCPLA